MKTPTKVPEKGFYYHYKHTDDKSVNDYAYEVLGVGFHTEDDCRPEDVHMVVYRPLYESSVFTAGKFFDIRPLEMWIGDVSKNGETFPRFKRILDPGIIAKLQKFRLEMYGE